MGFNQLEPLMMNFIKTTSHHSPIVSMNLFVALLCACIVIGHLLEENRWINESITALIIGLCTGVVILLTTGGKSSHLLVFSEDLFFIYLLPPIIFNAGFQVKKKQFFRNFMTIMLFGAIGTIISFAIISFGAMHSFKMLNIDSLQLADYLAIGAIFSATDSVCTLQVLNQEETPLLYSLVFGEGVVNDATAVVLFNAIQNFDLSHISSSICWQFVGNFLYLFITSTVLGVFTGLLSAYIIKTLYFARHSTDREVALMMLMAYFSYMLAELFNLSAILTVFFCGIVMSHYTWHNVTESSRVTTKHAFATLSFVAEIFIFLYVGMDALDIEKWRAISDSPGTSVGVSSLLLGLILLGRAAFVFPLSFMSNLTKKSLYQKITLKQQITVWWAGLMRGAVSMALAYNQVRKMSEPPTRHAYANLAAAITTLFDMGSGTAMFVYQDVSRGYAVSLRGNMFTRSGHTQLHGNALMITSTITVVLFSTVVFGLMTKPLIRFLLPSSNESNPSSPKSLSVPFLGNEDDCEAMLSSQMIATPMSLKMFFATPTHTVHHYWRKFDDSFMRPVFGGRGFVPFVPGSPIDGCPYQWK